MIGVFGIFLAVYFYQESIREREPCFITDPVRTSILKSTDVLHVPIKVTRTDGTEIRSDLNSVRYYLWNNGKEPIHAGNVLYPISIQFDDPTVRIIYPSVLKTSRDVTGMSASPDPQDPEKRLLVALKILERNDGISGQIIYEGNPDARLVISGVIEGAGGFKSDAFFQKRLMRAGYSVIATALVLCGALLSGTLRDSLKWLKNTSRPLRKARIRVIIILLHITAFAVLAYLFYSKNLQSNQNLHQQIVSRTVPESIIPRSN